MSYFIFIKDQNNVPCTLVKIAENTSDLNNLNINQEDYKIIEESQENFNAVKYGTKHAEKYNNNIINYINITPGYSKQELQVYLDNFKKIITNFTKNNINHTLFTRWNNYYNQLNSLNIDSITFPLNTSLETYFNNLGQPSFHPLQLP